MPCSGTHHIPTQSPQKVQKLPLKVILIGVLEHSPRRCYINAPLHYSPYLPLQESAEEANGREREGPM